MIEPWQRERVPRALRLMRERAKRMPEVFQWIHPTGEGHLGVGERGIMALVIRISLRRILATMLSEDEFLGPYGLRSISKVHDQNPYVFHVNGQEFRVGYLPAESDTGMFGGNSNWRGPVWMPVNVLIIRALIEFYLYYGDTFKVECPTGSGRHDESVRGGQRNYRTARSYFSARYERASPRVWRYGEVSDRSSLARSPDYFSSTFMATTGPDLVRAIRRDGPGCVAKLIEVFGMVDPKKFLEGGKTSLYRQDEPKR